LQVKLCDPRLSALSVVATIKALYKYTSFLPFTGDVMMMWCTSAGMQGQNDDSVVDARLTIGAGDTPAVAARMSSIFRAKKRREFLGGVAGSKGKVTITTEHC